MAGDTITDAAAGPYAGTGPHSAPGMAGGRLVTTMRLEDH